MSGALSMRDPERINRDHDLSGFENGKHPSLDEWLRSYALTSEGLSARTYVVCPHDEPTRVVGYYALSAAEAQRVLLPTAKLRKGTPERIPLVLIGRLAVDTEYRGRGLGAGLLINALDRCLAASQIAGVRAVVVHAIDDDAEAFYLRHHFLRSTLGDRTLVMPIENVAALVGDKRP